MSLSIRCCEERIGTDIAPNGNICMAALIHCELRLIRLGLTLIFNRHDLDNFKRQIVWNG